MHTHDDARAREPAGHADAALRARRRRARSPACVVPAAISSARSCASSGRGSLFDRPGQRHPRTTMHEVPGVGRAGAVHRRCVAGFWSLLRLSTSATPALPAARRAAIRLLYRFLLNKWYFDELYDFLFVGPAMSARPLPVEGRRRQIIDGLGPTASRRACVDVTRKRRAPADRLPLSLCLRHADRRRGARHLVHACRRSASR